LALVCVTQKLFVAPVPPAEIELSVSYTTFQIAHCSAVEAFCLEVLVVWGLAQAVGGVGIGPQLADARSRSARPAPGSSR
jgi:hypothetical protein